MADFAAHAIHSSPGAHRRLRHHPGNPPELMLLKQHLPRPCLQRARSRLRCSSRQKAFEKRPPPQTPQKTVVATRWPPPSPSDQMGDHGQHEGTARLRYIRADVRLLPPGRCRRCCSPPPGRGAGTARTGAGAAGVPIQPLMPRTDLLPLQPRNDDQPPSSPPAMPAGETLSVATGSSRDMPKCTSPMPMRGRSRKSRWCAAGSTASARCAGCDGRQMGHPCTPSSATVRCMHVCRMVSVRPAYAAGHRNPPERG
ncbi:hypothetical protein M433DRAFT_535436 [Acidomyces richmondensis BFW]|nr:MAG: hypothetical protein FE78DRAFT_367342 [Acidomyces sp. 'richmondensis']KYG46190.1 hypothetical protein M433DRAFT_535436 [Acidomyces richmondensis BFW]